jgi:cysteine-rich repeat protein
MIAWVSLGAALGIAIGSCAQVEQGPAVIPPEIVEEYCIKEVALISEVLAETDTLTSCISESTCDRGIDTGEEGYFETWHLYADETSTVVLDADSEFDNLMQLALITEITEQTVDTKVLAANDDRSANDPRAQIAATFEATRDYLLRLSSFGDEETGCYTIRTLRVAPDDPLPEPPDTGSVEVIVSSTGAAPVSYTVTLNGAKAKSVAANGTAMYEGIVTRDYAVALSGLGDCTVDGDNPQDVTVNADQTSAVSFTVSCELSGDCDPKDPNACNDANDCTDDICTASGTCEYSNADGNECDLMPGVGQCLDGACESLAAVCSPNPCNDDNECTNDVCKEENLEPVCSNDSKDKNAPCGPKGAQFCDGDGKCVECTGPSQCSDDNDCTVGETCEVNGVCKEGTPAAVGTSCDPPGGGTGVCSLASVCVPAGCGNGILGPSEVCDDGNQTDGDGCSANCRSDETCGNDVVDATVGEVCDDGNTIAGDGCSANCRSDETCGNDVVDAAAGEVCDDGNTTAGDGCSADCRSDESEVIAVSAGLSYTCAVKADGSLYCWGTQSPGFGSSLTATEVTGLPSPAKSVACGGQSTAKGLVCVHHRDRMVSCFGENSFGNLYSSSPVTARDYEGNSIEFRDAESIHALTVSACARTQDRGVKCWGHNGFGQLGQGDFYHSDTWLRVPGVSNSVALDASYHACSVSGSGGVQCWGANNDGQLGDGTKVDLTNGGRSLPANVLGLSDAIQVATGRFHTCAVHRAGGVSCWGDNDYGQLGLGVAGEAETTPKAIPVSTLSGVIAITAGEYHTCAISSSRDVFCWGRNNLGQLGLGNNIDTASPKLSFRNAIAITANYDHTCALRPTGDVWCWGRNDVGQLGSGELGPDECRLAGTDRSWSCSTQEVQVEGL